MPTTCTPECFAQRLSYRAGIPAAAAQMIAAEFARLEARIAVLERLTGYQPEGIERR